MVNWSQGKNFQDLDFECLGFLYGVSGEAARLWFNKASVLLLFFSFDRLLQVLDSIYTSSPFMFLTRNVTDNRFLRVLYEKAHSATLRWNFYLLPFTL